MNILVFGAENKIGKHLIKQAIQQGHYVTAFLPSQYLPDIVPFPNLSVHAGDTLNYEAVEEAMQGQEIVIEALMQESPRSVALITESTFNIIKAMRVNKVKRIVMLSQVGAADSLRQGPFFYRLGMYFSAKSKSVLPDKTIREAYVQKSGLEWTIVRSVNITNSKKFKKELDVSTSPAISLRKASVAGSSLVWFLLNTAIHNNYINRIIGISDK